VSTLSQTFRKQRGRLAYASTMAETLK